MNPPETRYAHSGDVNIAYQVVGNGAFDLVFVPGWVSNLELAWEDPYLARFYERLASFSRLILFDKRGTGLSDRVPISELPTLELRMDDVRAVMDAVGSERAAIFGMSEGGNLSVLFAATCPERTIALITFGIFAKRVWSPDYPWVPRWEDRQNWMETVEKEWGGPVDIETLAPTLANDERFKKWFVMYMRRSASPRDAAALARMNTQIDIRSVLPTIHVPTLVMHRTHDRDANIEEGRYIASRITDAKFLELPGEDHLVWTGDQDSVLDAVEEFLTGTRTSAEPDRVLATVMFTDIVGSTQQAVQLGDRRWRELLDTHYGLIRQSLTRFRGHEVKSTGDGILATFDGPARAVRCASAASDGVR